MRKLSIFLHVSTDGFVAGPNGEMNWVHVDEEIFNHTSELTAKADAYLMGRKTYEMMQAYWPTAADKPDASKHDIEHAEWYKNVHKIVISKTLKGKQIENTEIISDDLKNSIEKIKNSGGKNIIIFGSPSTSHSLMENDLIDEFGLFINPILIGKGIPVFDKINSTLALTLESSKAFSSGVVFNRYLRNRK